MRTKKGENDIGEKNGRRRKEGISGGIRGEARIEVSRIVLDGAADMQNQTFRSSGQLEQVSAI